MNVSVRRLVAVLFVAVALLACNALATTEAMFAQELTRVKLMPEAIAMSPASYLPLHEEPLEAQAHSSSSNEPFDHTILTGGIVTGVVIVLVIGVCFFLTLCAEVVYIIRDHFRRIHEQAAAKKSVSM